MFNGGSNYSNGNSLALGGGASIHLGGGSCLATMAWLFRRQAPRIGRR